MTRRIIQDASYYYYYQYCCCYYPVINIKFIVTRLNSKLLTCFKYKSQCQHHLGHEAETTSAKFIPFHSSALNY